MQSLQFEWEPRKAATNLRKHRVSFAEAKTVFLDEEALLLPDDENSSDEERFTILGISSRVRILVVCHCYRKTEDIIRIISARKANRTEREQYLERIRI
ncbi:MAG: BrnT family toxin [bacterium]